MSLHIQRGHQFESLTALRGIITKKISTCKFFVYFYDTVAQTSHKNINFRVLWSLTFNFLIDAFLDLSLLGAGSGERTRTSLGAHQKRFSLQIKDNTAVAIYNRITFPVLYRKFS
jgi:hypothetical protein